MFRLPWKVHGVTAGPPHNLLVHIEHTHLLELYERALETIDEEIGKTTEPKFSNSHGAPKWRDLQHDRQHYVEMIDWLRNLRVV